MCKVNQDMYELYDQYNESLRIVNKLLRKLQNENANIRSTYGSPFKRRDYNRNKNDITALNKMANDLIDSMMCIEMYLEFDDRKYLHREYHRVKRMIQSPHSYEGEVLLDYAYMENVPDNTETIINSEIQDLLLDTINEVLTDRQRKIIELYFWESMTQKEIGEIFGITQQGVAKSLESSLSIIRSSLDYDFSKI